MRLVCQPRWMRRLQVGHVLNMRGQLRVVREVSRRPDGSLRCVLLAIRSCSWTGRPYTIYTASDLKTMGARLTRAKRRRLQSDADRRLLATRRQNYSIAKGYAMTCCEAKDMP